MTGPSRDRPGAVAQLRVSGQFKHALNYGLPYSVPPVMTTIEP
jgi:hypothetical protein